MTVTSVHFPDNMVDYHRGGPAATFAPPHRKPLPGSSKVPADLYQPAAPTQYAQQPSEQSYPFRPSPAQSPQFQAVQQVSSLVNSHSRTRTASSSSIPLVNSTGTFSSGAPSPPSSFSQTPTQNRRFSSNTVVSASTGGPVNPATNMQLHRQGTGTSTSSGVPRRSTSSRSSNLAPTSYVALMRKQKATVWCDRSQNIDPRTAAAQKAARHRAALEVHGSGRTSTLASGKIRAQKPGTYIPANLSGVSVPLRLSANEMLGDEEERSTEARSTGDATSTSATHNRTGSGRSSVHSGKYPSGYPRSSQGRFSTGNTPPSGGEVGSPNEKILELAETPTNRNTNDYFGNKSGRNASVDSVSPEKEDNFGHVKEMNAPSAVALAAEQARKAEELRRRGSVDERTMTMGGKGRLFIANPD